MGVCRYPAGRIRELGCLMTIALQRGVASSSSSLVLCLFGSQKLTLATSSANVWTCKPIQAQLISHVELCIRADWDGTVWDETVWHLRSLPLPMGSIVSKILAQIKPPGTVSCQS